MQYEPIKRKKNYEVVMEQIISMIRSKHLQPGEKLDSIEKLSHYFNVSRSVIREALSGLKAMGLVDIQQGEGTFIADFKASSISLPVTTALLMKKEDIKELFQVRKILEVGAVRLAAHNCSEENMIQIKQVLIEMKKNNKLDEEADFNFHYQIVRASQNMMLINLLSSISEIMIETIRDAQKIMFDSEINEIKLIKEHELIYEAIKNKLPDQAEKYMLSHLEGVERSLAPYIN